MGTRSLTVFKNNDNKEICRLYRQYDGYPSGHGKDLSELLSNSIVVNGIGEGKVRAFNGMDDLAVRVIASLKSFNHSDPNMKGQTNIPGNFYLMPPKTSGVGEEYTYTLYKGMNNLISLSVESTYHGVLFDGPIDEFDPENCEKKEK